MLRVDLVVVLGFFIGKNQVQRHLIRLVDDRSVAGCHLADVKMQNPWDRSQIFISPGDQFVSRVGDTWIGPKNDNVRKHGYIYFSLILQSRAMLANTNPSATHPSAIG